jgi:hypothetical protein
MIPSDSQTANQSNNLEIGGMFCNFREYVYFCTDILITRKV